MTLGAGGDSEAIGSLSLNEKQTAAVQSAWQLATQGSGCENKPGLATFRQIFMQLDEIRHVFGFTGTDDHRFLSHTIVFCNYLNKLMDVLDDPVKFDQLCDSLGRRHAHVRQVDFRPDFWDTFSGALVSCALDEPPLPTQIAWRHVVRHMVHVMKTGYYDEMNVARSPVA